MSNKSWKNFLLSSSIPLEHSVKEILNKYEISSREYNYLRENESGITTNFSVDLSAFCRCEKYKKTYDVDYLIECKYRHTGTQWIFMPDKITFTELTSFICNEFCNNFEIAEYLFQEYFSNYPLVDKGIEILPNNFNPKSIKQSIQQLSYAYVNKKNDNFDILYNYRDLFLIIPIIVTTAELWKIKDNITLEDFQKNNDITEIAEQKDLLIIQNQPDNLLEKYSLDKFSSLPDYTKIKLSKLLNRKYKDASIEEEFEAISSLYPDNYIVINYNSFEREFIKLHEFLKQGSFLKESEGNK